MLNTNDRGLPRDYGQEVPAVARAVRALEELARAEHPLTLAALRRATGDSASSLLATLRTLCRAGLVHRSREDGAYGLGPSLARLGAVAARRHPHATGDVELSRLADELADAVRAWAPGALAATLSLRAAPATPSKPRLAPTPPGETGKMPSEELEAFLRGAWVATLSYLTDDGYPATVPLRYAWDGDVFWLVPRREAEWAEHVRRQPRVSLAISESDPPLRRVLARGQLLPAQDESPDLRRAVLQRFSRRYGYAPDAADTRGSGRGETQLFRLAPDRLIAWRGLLRHPAQAKALGSQAPTHSRRQSA